MGPHSTEKAGGTDLTAPEILVYGQSQARDTESDFDVFSLAVISVLTVIAVAIHGYHPYAEDGGIYLPGVYKLIDPALYPAWTGFVTAQSKFSLFAAVVAGIVRFSGISVMSCVLGIHLAGIWTTLWASWQILLRCSIVREAAYAGVCMLAVCLTIPIAGTSLILVDPYVTARSISTPCTLLAMVGALDLIAYFKRVGRVRLPSMALCGASLLVTAAMHPLMAAYAAGCVVLLAFSAITRAKLRVTAFALIAMCSATIAYLLNRFAPTPPQGYTTVALTRYYWFLSEWQWYEVVGLIAPLLVLFLLSRYTGFREPARWLVRMAISGGVIGLVVSLLFARESSPSYFVAMLQPLRIFLVVYVAMILLAGVVLADVFLMRRPLRWAATLFPLGGVMLFFQIQTYPHSSHLEFPWGCTGNDWERGFVWIRDHTPKDAVFALDAKYILTSGEDAQNFRAIAQRSSLPDYQKDGGIAAIEPDLSSGWVTGQSIQGDLVIDGDAQRRLKLAEVGVQWLVLPASSVTGFWCPYENESMRVCRIPDR